MSQQAARAWVHLATTGWVFCIHGYEAAGIAPRSTSARGPMRAVAAALKHRCWLAHNAAHALGAEFVSVRRETGEAAQVFWARGLGVWGQGFGGRGAGAIVLGQAWGV